jgi:WD40 repeat protein
MRFLLPFVLLTFLPALALGEEPKKAPPIEVIKLQRKEPVDYAKDIDPILTKKCTVCHSGANKESGLDLGSYEGLMKGGKRSRVNANTKSVVPGKPLQSLIVLTAGRTGSPKMPRPMDVTQQPLSPKELALITLWIAEGAKAPKTALVRLKPVVSTPPPGVKAVGAVAISPDNSAVAASRGNQIHIYDAGKGAFIRTLLDANLTTPDKKPVQAAHLSLVKSLAYSVDGKLLASGSYQEVTLWDVQTGALRRKLTGFADEVVGLSFSSDGRLLATGGGDRGGDPSQAAEIKIFEVMTGKLVVDIGDANALALRHSDTVFGVAFSPDGTKLATCGADKFIKVFEVPSGKFIPGKSFEGHTHHVMDVGWKGDGTLLASCSADKTIKIWDYEKGEQVRTINNAHGKDILRLVFVGKGSLFLTCSLDGTVRKWNVDQANAAPGNFTGGRDCMNAVASSPDGTVVATGGEEGIVRLYNGTTSRLIKELLPPGEEPPTPPKK